MPSALTVKNHLAKASLKMYDHDPGTTAASVVSPDGGPTQVWLDMARFHAFVVGVFNSVSASQSGPTLVEILAAIDANGNNPQVVVSSGVIASILVGQNYWIECSAAQIKEIALAAGLELRYVSARITCSHADECVVLMGRMDPVYAHDGLTASFNQ